jgi:hypothetical protein
MQYQGLSKSTKDHGGGAYLTHQRLLEPYQEHSSRVYSFIEDFPKVLRAWWGQDHARFVKSQPELNQKNR